MASGDTKTEHFLDVLANGSRADIPTDNCCNTKTQNYILGAVDRMISLEEEVEELQNNPDVTDIVSTYQDLTNYDKTTLTDGDVIRVLTDSTHDDESAYYRYNAATDSFDYIGTTRAYTDFVGTSGEMAGAAGLVPAPQATDADKFLKSDGTWATVSGGGGGGGGTTNYNSLSNKPKINNVTLEGNKSLSELGVQPAGDYALESEIPDVSNLANKISVVQTSASTIEINPNTFYKFGEVASLNITLASITDNTIYNEYMFEFVSGTTATTLTLPSSIKWLETPTIDANKIYQCSIVDNVGLLVGVTNV